MRKLTTEELELIIGGGDTYIEQLPTVVIIGHSTPDPDPAPPDPDDPGLPDIDFPPAPPLPEVPEPDFPPLPTTPPLKPCPTVPALASADRIDRAVVRQQEGGLHTTGYALDGNKFPNSGVTIGRGVDLGTKTTSQLSSWGMSQSGIATLAPYLGYKGTAAQQILVQLGAPVISTADALAISNSAEQQIFSSAISYYNSRNPTVPFYQLPDAAQTVLVDIAYNLGSLSKAPNFTGYAASGQWDKVVSELRNWTGNKPDPLTVRHNADADNIQRAINANSLSSGSC